MLFIPRQSQEKETRSQRILKMKHRFHVAQFLFHSRGPSRFQSALQKKMLNLVLGGVTRQTLSPSSPVRKTKEEKCSGCGDERRANGTEVKCTYLLHECYYSPRREERGGQDAEVEHPFFFFFFLLLLFFLPRPRSLFATPYFSFPSFSLQIPADIALIRSRTKA